MHGPRAASIVVLVVALLLAACGQAQQNTGTAAGPASKPSGGASSAAAATAPPVGGVSAAPAGAPSASDPPTLQKLKVAYNALAAELAPAFLGEDQGLYRKHGLDVELILLSTSAQIAPALMNQEIGLAYTASAGTVASRVQGSDLIMISSYLPYMDFTIYGRPDIQRVEDLRGKRVGVTRFGGGLHLAAQLILQRHDLDPERDAQLAQLGGVPEIFAALSGGAVDAGMLTTPEAFIAEDQGYRKLQASLDYRIPYTMVGVGGSQRFIADNPELVQRFMRAHLEGIALFKNDREAAQRTIAKWTKAEDQSVLTRTWDHAAPVMERVPLVDPASIQTVLDQLAPQVERARGAKADEFYDNRFVQEQERGGFIRQLYP